MRRYLGLGTEDSVVGLDERGGAFNRILNLVIKLIIHGPNVEIVDEADAVHKL